MKVHAHTLPPPPTPLLPNRTSAARTTATVAANTQSNVSTALNGTTAWQSTLAATASSLSGTTVQPVASRQGSVSTRGYAPANAIAKQPNTPAPTNATPAAQTAIDPGDLPYTRGSLIDIKA